jgi:hypothetical protein
MPCILGSIVAFEGRDTYGEHSQVAHGRGIFSRFILAHHAAADAKVGCHIFLVLEGAASKLKCQVSR